MNPVAWNRALDTLGTANAKPFEIFSTPASFEFAAESDQPLLRAAAYSRAAGDHLLTGVAKGLAAPVLSTVGATHKALQQPGLAKATVLVAPEAALLGGTLVGAVGLLMDTGAACACLLAASYNVGQAGVDAGYRAGAAAWHSVTNQLNLTARG